MKLSLDPKFLTTSITTFVVLVGAVVLLNKIAGPAAASVAGTVIGAVAIKLFDKLDYNPTFDIQFGAPRISAPWLYSAVAAVFILYGCDLPSHFARSLFQRFAGGDFECRVTFWLTVVALDWGGYLLGGWIIGRLFSTRALVFSSIAGLSLILVSLVDPELVADPERLRRISTCVLGVQGDNADFAALHSGFRLGAILGIASRAYLAIVMARLASRLDNTKTDPVPAA